jgi:uncharacterized protein
MITIQTLQQTMMDAMKQKDMPLVQIMRMLVSSVKNKAIDKGAGAELTEDEIMAVLKKQLKETEESLDMYTKAGNTEEIASLTKTQEVIKNLLPKELTDEALDIAVQQAVTEAKAGDDYTDKMLLPMVMKALKGKASGDRIMPLINKYR